MNSVSPRRPGRDGVRLLGAALLFFALLPGAAHAAPCTPPVTNAVACENTLPGLPKSEWYVEGDGDQSIQGFATPMSVNKGQTISFKIDSETSNFHIDILRLGYYNGDGARMIAENLRPTGPSSQPACQTFSDSGLIDCGNWSVTRTWTVPSNAVSGVYIANLTRDDTGGASQIIFVVRDDADPADIAVQTSDATWQAYNDYGGNSLYRCTVACPPGEPAGYKAAYKVSYNRPLQTEAPSALFTGGEYPLIRFLEANGYDVTYISGVDVHERPQLLTSRKVFISSGHDEYWSASQRTAMENARDAGVSLAFFTGNEGFWKTRWEPSAAGPSTPNRTLVSYKDTHFTTRQDPVEWTGTWRDPRYSTPAENTPENALTGQSFIVNSGTSRITVPAAYGKLRFWRNTAVASMTSGSLQLAPDTLGYEWDEDPDNGYRPAGSIRLSSTTVSNVEVFTDYGSTTRFDGTATHNMTLYRVPSGALVFGSGTVQWAFGLDTWNPGGNPVDRNMQQATVNLLADMGAQPATLISGLKPASKSTDNTPPTATLTTPISSATSGTTVTLAGTASDAGGGVVAGVEVSTDGGATWHRANGTTSWTYSWSVSGAPSTRIKVRATDDSGNTQTPGPGTLVTVNCPCSLWGQNGAPAIVDSGDPSPIEVGMKFRSDTYGAITGVRFYKAAANTGTHTGSLWTADGQRLARATFTNESASGWQTATFDQPVVIQPNTWYVVSYFAPNGHYSATPDYFYRAPSAGPSGGGTLDAAPLHAQVASGQEINGLYAYGSNSAFPTATHRATNYWVDAVFTPIPVPGQVTGVSATSGGVSSANVTWTPPTSGGAPTEYTITAYVGSTAKVTKTVPVGVTSTIVTGLTTGTTYRFTVKASNPAGSGLESSLSNAVTPTQPVVPSTPTNVKAASGTSSAQVTWNAPVSDGDSAIIEQTVTPYVNGIAQTPTDVSPSATRATITGLTNGVTYTFKVTATNGVGVSPQSAASNPVTPQKTIFDFTEPTGGQYIDGTPVELGVKFTVDFDGAITGIRFYKSADNTGTHIGRLWSSSGQLLASATFTAESATGWQSVTFSSPVQVVAGTTYVASYFSPEGVYVSQGWGLASPIDAGPIQTVANGVSPNGVYVYGPNGGFPTDSHFGSNYWVDVLYAIALPGQPTNVHATTRNTTSVNVSWTAPTSGGPVDSYRVTPYVGATAKPQLAKTVDAPATSTTVTGLQTGTAYTFRVEALNVSGAGPASAASNAATPAAVVPSAPTNVRATPATNSVRVTWTPPDNDGDSALTGQTITPYVGGVAQAPISVSASATEKTITGLTNGVQYTFKVTATNSVGTSPASEMSNPATPWVTIFDYASPGVVNSGDQDSVELGVKFRTSFAGKIRGIRFYKGTNNTGTHIGNLWTASGTKLASAVFTNETASGWQTVEFAQPVAITPGTTYVASYFAPNGGYSYTSSGFASAIANNPLTALADGTSSNGVYAYGASSSFPQSSWGASNYFVDVLFEPAPVPGTPTNVSAVAGRHAATVSWTAPTSGGPVESYVITPYIGTQAQPSTTATSSPVTVTGLTPGQTYRFTVRATNFSGSSPESALSAPVVPTAAQAPSAPTGVAAQADSEAAIVRWTAPSNDGGTPITGYTVTPYRAGQVQTPIQLASTATVARITGLTAGQPYTFTVKAVNSAGSSDASEASAAITPGLSLFGATTPATADSGDGDALNLGVKFRSDVAGTVTGVRFYKSAANTGTHVGTLYDAAGNVLARSTFENETATGWQTVTFDTPVAINAGDVYVASYFAPNGHYAVTGSAFSSGPLGAAPLHALANSESGNGVFRYGAEPAFPFSSYNSGNYWVDVLFVPAGA